MLRCKPLLNEWADVLTPRRRFRLLPRPDIVEIHRPSGAAEAPGDRVVRAHRLVRRLEGPEPDALILLWILA
jgi:hypothetical protein